MLICYERKIIFHPSKIHIDKIKGKSIGDCEENYENITISTRNCLGVLKQEMCVCLIFCFILVMVGGKEK